MGAKTPESRGGPASGDIIAELVHQFSDPYAFYRELIQNSIDAGSTRIEVTLRHQPGSPGGMTTATVADWGEGMDRTIIERFLLTKFRSSKEGDLTKIGKFGIGFLSVFAPAPDLVVVDTGRNGEYWRLLFHPDLSYELLRSEAPCEGTHVSLHKSMTAAEYAAFAERSEEAVRRWCRHSDADVAFARGGEDGSAPPFPAAVREPFAVGAPFEVGHEDAHTRIVAGWAREDPPTVGFYNRGLTLLEAREALVPGVTFKVISDHLEHTLTRDNVRRDRHFERIVATVAGLAQGDLREGLPRALEAVARRPEPGADYECLLRHAERLHAAGKLGADAFWFPTTGGACSGAALLAAAERHQVLLWAERSDPLTAALEEGGTPVLRTPEAHPAALLSAAKRVAGARVLKPAAREFSVALPAPRADAAGESVAPGDATALVDACIRLLEAAQASTAAVAGASLHGASRQRPWMLVEELGAPEKERAAPSSPFARGSPRMLCLNLNHPRVRDAALVARRAPDLAALLLLRQVATSRSALDADLDRRLTGAALAGVAG